MQDEHTIIISSREREKFREEGEQKEEVIHNQDFSDWTEKTKEKK
jgi:hypothetical protein